MTTRTSYYPSGKFDSAQDEVVYRHSLDMSFVEDSFGDTDLYGLHFTRIDGLYGWDWIVIEDSQGFVSVERHQPAEPIRVIGSAPVEQAWLKYEQDYLMWAEANDAEAQAEQDAESYEDSKVGR